MTSQTAKLASWQLAPINIRAQDVSRVHLAVSEYHEHQLRGFRVGQW
jgi:hypothetical protein